MTGVYLVCSFAVSILMGIFAWSSIFTTFKASPKDSHAVMISVIWIVVMAVCMAAIVLWFGQFFWGYVLGIMFSLVVTMSTMKKPNDQEGQ